MTAPLAGPYHELVESQPVADAPESVDELVETVASADRQPLLPSVGLSLRNWMISAAIRRRPPLGLAGAVGVAAERVEVDRAVGVVEELVEQDLADHVVAAAIAAKIAVEQLRQPTALHDELDQAMSGGVRPADAGKAVEGDRRARHEEQPIAAAARAERIEEQLDRLQEGGHRR